MKYIIVLVHGTWGRGDDAWYQPSEKTESFTNRLMVALSERGIDSNDLIIVRHEWEHGNTHSDRLDGAEALSEKLLNLKTEYSDARFHFVAHSHGGNVVLKAMEIYLRKLRVAHAATLDWETALDVYNACNKLLERINFDEDSFSERNHGLAVAMTRLLGQLDKISPCKPTLFRRFPKIERIIFLYRRGLVQARLRRVLYYFYANPEHHRISSITTLGTPFYYKEWKHTRTSRLIDPALGALPAFVVVGIFLYAVIVFFAWLFALIPPVPWIGLNPLEWPWGILLFIGIFTVSQSVGFYFADDPRTRNTNIYFDEAAENAASVLHTLEDRKICRVLNVHASYLDEVYAALSAYPLVSSGITHALDRLEAPSLWTFSGTRRRTGATSSVAASVRRTARTFYSFFISMVFIAIYPIRYLLHLFSSRYLARRARKDLRVFAYGLPARELSESKIEVSNVLRESYMEIHEFAIGNDLRELRINSAQEVNRFSFLWNDDELKSRLEQSFLRKFLSDELSDEQSRQLLALEERVKEFFGVSGLRHSMYYDNKAVIQAVGDFIAQKAPPPIDAAE